MKTVRKRYRKYLCMLLTGLLLSGSLWNAQVMNTQAAALKPLKLEQVLSLALAGSGEYIKLVNSRSAKQVAYQAAVKSIKLKREDKATFRWTPLLDFKFPEEETLADEYEYIYKPYLLQAQISSVEHQINDVKYAVGEKVSILYAKLYEKQQTIAFNEERLENLHTALKRRSAQVLTGKATKSDVEKVKKAIASLTATVASDTSAFMADKKKLGDMLNLDISTGYSFQNPFVQANITRQDVEELTERTLAYNQGMFDKKLATGSAMVAMDTNYSLLKKQYGDKASPLASYISQAKQGEKLNAEALKAAYQKVLDDIEEPWTGSFKILFISIPKEWLKGVISGARYIEDDPYALYTSILAYQEALAEQVSTEKELKQQVTDTYSALVAVKKAYIAAVEQSDQTQKDLDEGTLLNRQAQMTEEELGKIQDEYNSGRLEELKALSAYAQALYSFDRLTCGGVTQLLEETDADLSAASGGRSYILADMVEGANYYIRNIVEDNSFEFGVYIPEDFKIDVTAYELWVDSTQIGERTQVDKTIVHMNLSTSNAKKVFVRLYNGEDFIDDCVVDPAAYSGSLNVTAGYSVTRSVDNVVGSFTYTTNADTRITTIRLKLNSDEPARYYVVKDAQGTDLLAGRKLKVTEGFSYLSLAAGSLDELQIEFYDKLEKKMYTAHLDSMKLSIRKDTAPDSGQ